VRFLHRVKRRGLSSACVEGMLATIAPYLVVMDGDLQHDESLIPQMLSRLQDTDCEMVLGSRFKEERLCEGLSAGRERLSHTGIRLANFVLRAELSDPLTGFFAIRRATLLEVVNRLSLKGFKIVVDILSSAERPLKCVELPMRFREREYGMSKLDIAVYGEFAFVLADKLLGRFLPVRFLMFVLVGLSGVVVHLSLLSLLYALLQLPFLMAQGLATYAAMVSNFCLNNQLTYRDQRLRGWRFALGLFSFCAICSIGAGLNLVVADSLFSHSVAWPVAGLLGAMVGAVWNYGVTSTLTWRAMAPRSRIVGG
jgi:dolichol-phosphate mannosyltransferase